MSLISGVLLVDLESTFTKSNAIATQANMIGNPMRMICSAPMHAFDNLAAGSVKR